MKKVEVVLLFLTVEILFQDTECPKMQLLWNQCRYYEEKKSSWNSFFYIII